MDLKDFYSKGDLFLHLNNVERYMTASEVCITSFRCAYILLICEMSLGPGAILGF